MTVIDLRRPEAFGGAHIPGALNIGAGQNLSLWAGWLIPPDQRLLLVDDKGETEKQSVLSLASDWTGLKDLFTRACPPGSTQAWSLGGPSSSPPKAEAAHVTGPSQCGYVVRRHFDGIMFALLTFILLFLVAAGLAIYFYMHLHQ